MSTAEYTRPAVAGDMGVNGAEVPVCYRRGPGVDGQAQGPDMEIPVKANDGGRLMVGSSKKIAARVKFATTESETSAPKLRETQHLLRPLPQDIPQVLIQAVTPPDSKLHYHLAEDATEGTITTGRLSPAPGPIITGQGASPVTLIPYNRLPQNLGLATPEYTLVNHSALIPYQSTNAVPGELQREEVHVYTPKPGKFIDWSGHSTVGGFGGKAQVDTQSRIDQGYTDPRVNTLPITGVSPPLQGISLVPLDRGLINPGSATVKSSGCAANETEVAIQDPNSATVVVYGFACPPENYIHAHFTAEALRRQWELSQSFTQWRKLKTSNIEGPIVPFNVMEESYGQYFLRQHPRTE